MWQIAFLIGQKRRNWRETSVLLLKVLLLVSKHSLWCVKSLKVYGFEWARINYNFLSLSIESDLEAHVRMITQSNLQHEGGNKQPRCLL